MMNEVEMNTDEATARTMGSTQATASSMGVDAHEPWQRTAIAAFFLAEARGFDPGHELDDWLIAERLVDAALLATAVSEDTLTTVEQSALTPPPVSAKRSRKPSEKSMAAGIEQPPKKKATADRKAASRTRKTKPGIEVDLGGTA